MKLLAPHWQRFLALRVKSADVVAMTPRLGRGAILVIDRHYNALTPWKQERNMYLVRSGGEYMVRYIEEAGGELVLRSHNPELPLQVLLPESGSDSLSAIVGRVCFVHLHV